MTILNAKGEPVRLSASKLKDAQLCMHSFKLAHIDLLEERKASKFLHFGTVMHEVFELSHLEQDPPTKKQMKDWLKEFWIPKEEKELMSNTNKHSWEVLGYDTLKDEVEFKELGNNIIDTYFDNTIKKGNYISNEHTEVYFRLPFLRGFEISGKIDRIVRTSEGKVQIVDWKTSKKTASVNQLLNDFQLGIYWWASKVLFNLQDEDIEDIGLYYLRHAEYHGVKFDQFSLGGVMGQIDSILEDIERGYFPYPKQYNKWKCNYCDSRAYCPLHNK